MNRAPKQSCAGKEGHGSTKSTDSGARYSRRASAGKARCSEGSTPPVSNRARSTRGRRKQIQSCHNPSCSLPQHGWIPGLAAVILFSSKKETCVKICEFYHCAETRCLRRATTARAASLQAGAAGGSSSRLLVGNAEELLR